jgi:hypothetical protein
MITVVVKIVKKSRSETEIEIGWIGHLQLYLLMGRGTDLHPHTHI